MKKILLILCLIIPVSAQAIDEATCSAVGGRFIQGGYCQSSISLNWWNARSWCLSLGGDLVDLNTVCPTYYQSGKCPEMIFGGWYVWARNVSNVSNAYMVNLDHGGTWYYNRKTDKAPACCQ